MAVVRRAQPAGVPPGRVEQHQVLPVLAARRLPRHRRRGQPRRARGRRRAGRGAAAGVRRGRAGGGGAHRDGWSRHRAGDAAIVGHPLGRAPTRSRPRPGCAPTAHRATAWSTAPHNTSAVAALGGVPAVSGYPGWTNDLGPARLGRPLGCPAGDVGGRAGAIDLIDQYGVDWVVIGPRERLDMGAVGRVLGSTTANWPSSRATIGSTASSRELRLGRTWRVLCSPTHDEGAAGMEGRMIELSVVMPVFNEAPIIGGVVADVTRRVLDVVDDAELVMVDDRGTDGSSAILAELVGLDPRYRLVVNPINRGHGPSVLAGMAAARGTWILQLDSDGQVDLDVFAEVWGSSRHVRSGGRCAGRPPGRAAPSDAVRSRQHVGVDPGSAPRARCQCAVQIGAPLLGRAPGDRAGHLRAVDPHGDRRPSRRCPGRAGARRASAAPRW